MKSSLMFFILLLTANLAFAQTGTKMVAPAIIEGFATITSAAGTTTLTRASETKQIVTGSTTQTVKLPDATTMSKELGRRFYIINKSSGNVTLVDAGSNTLATVAGATQVEAHLRAAGSANGTWDILASSGGGGGGTWGSITGTLSAQTDLQSALDLKAPIANPTFTGLIGTPLVISKAVTTNASGQLAASTTSSTQIGYLSNITQDLQTSLDAKTDESVLTTKGDTYVATASATLTRQAAGADGTTLLADSLTTNGVRYGTPVGTDNFMKGNPSAEANSTSGWSTYADAAGTAPVDCTGGTPNTTWAANNSAPILNGSFQFLATLNSGATRQGEGISYAFSIPTADSASPKVHQIEFDYAVASGTFVAGSDTDRTATGDSTFTVWVYDVTNARLIQPSTYRLYSNTGYRVVTNFQNNSGSTSYRLCIHKGTSATVASNITTKFDDFRIDRAKYTYGTPISDWTSYTYTGFTSTNGVVSSRWRRVGDTMEIKQNVEWSAAAGAFTGVFGLPSGYSIDTSKLALNTLAADRTIVGRAQALDSGNLIYDMLVSYRDTTTVNVWSINTTGTFSTNSGLNATTPFAFNANDTLNLIYSVPIAGWSSSTQVSDGFNSAEISFVANVSTTAASASTPFIYTTVVSNKGGGYNVANGKFTAPTSGTYFFRANMYTGATLAEPVCYLNTTAYSRGSAQPSAGTPGEVSCVAVMNAGDTMEIRPNGAATASGDLTLNNFSGFRIDSSQTISATEIVAASYTGTSGTITAGGTRFIVDAPTKVYDTHNAVTTGASWKFTAPISGIYTVKYISQHASATYTTGAGLSAELYKNGSFYSSLTNSHSQQAATAVGPVLSGSMDVSLNAGDYIDVREAIGGSVAATIYSSIIAISRVK